MGKRLVKLAVVAGAVASIGVAGPAAATTPVCVGTAQTAGVCAEVSRGGYTYQDCVYVGPPPCIPVNVPGVDVECGGWIGDNWWLECA